jgi:O-succinylbenzoate synthase
MQLWTCRYTLKPRRRLSAVAGDRVREGALLRVAGEDATTADGFADVHPWPELGDAPLDEQLARLARGEDHPALHHARVDAAARTRGVSLFEGLTIPESHWPGDDPPDAFDTVKLKSADSIPPRVRMRIDFNATLREDEFLRVARTLPRERIDFIEDPCPHVSEGLRARCGMRIARDRATGVADVLVHKPALSAAFPDFEGEIVVTSYMDHPVGQFHAAYIAATHGVSARCGLFTHVLYEPNPFLESIRAEGARLLPPEGTGIGFDELLERLPWRRL